MNRRIWLLGLLFVILVFVISGNLFPFLVFASIIFALAIHEAGHAVKLIKYGITIREFGLGIDVISLIKKRPAGPGILTIGPHSLALGTRRIRIPRLVLHPLLIGAYVDHPESEREKLDALPTAAKLEIYSSGAYTNLLMAAILFLMIFWLLFTLYIAHGIYPSKFLLLHLLAGILYAHNGQSHRCNRNYCASRNFHSTRAGCTYWNNWHCGIGVQCQKYF